MLECEWNIQAKAAYMKRWNVGRTIVWEDTQAVYAMWADDAALLFKNPTPEINAQMRELQRRAMKNVLTFPTAAKMLIERGKIAGAYPAERKEVTVRGKVEVEVSTLTPQEQARIVYDSFEDACALLGIDPPPLPALPEVIDVEAE